MNIKKIYCLFIILVSVPLLYGGDIPIMPRADFTLNFCNFPQAWTVSQGDGVSVGVVYNKKENTPKWEEWVTSGAPKTKTFRISPESFLNAKSKLPMPQILLLMEDTPKKAFPKTVAAIKSFSDKGVIVIMPAYFGPMNKDRDYSAWRGFVSDAHLAGAVVVGVHGKQYELGHLSFWKDIPIDIFALDPRVNGFSESKADAYLKTRLHSTAPLVASASSLIVSKSPGLIAADLKKLFREKGRAVLWGHVSVEWQKDKPVVLGRGFLNQVCLNRFIDENPGAKLLGSIKGHCLDAGLLLGLPPMSSGQWSFQALRAGEAQMVASGKGVVVALLDWLFFKDNPIYKDRLFKPGSVTGEPVFTSSGHGDWMAKALLKIAPDIKIMPVRIVPKGKYRMVQNYYAAGIRYAVKNGADIISLSHRQIDKNKLPELDEAIKEATAKGVTFVYIHYYGKLKEAIKSDCIEFASRKRQGVNIIGTNFIDDESFPYTWGMSQTAPIVSGVIALMKELNPALKPLDISRILSESVNQTPDGFPLLDALKAITAVKK